MTIAHSLSRINYAKVPQAPAMLLGGAFAFLVILVLLSATLFQNTRTQRNQLIQTVETQRQVNNLMAALRAMESGKRGYLLTGDPQFLDIYKEMSPAISQRLSAIRSAVQGNAAQERVLQDLDPLLESKLNEMADTIRLFDSGDREKAVNLIRAQQGMRLMDTIRQQILKLGVDVQDQRIDQYRAAELQARWLFIVNIAVVAVILGLAAISVYTVRRANITMEIAQNALKAANLDLEANVAARTAELTAANEEIQKFAYIVSHDLRSPLVNIMGFTSEIETLKGLLVERIGQQAETPGGDGDRQEPLPQKTGGLSDSEIAADFDEALGFIKAATSKMDRLINAVLTISREGNRRLKPEPVDLNELFETINSAVAHQAQESETQIQVSPLPSIVSDRLALEQVFSNLIDNALKYLRPDVQGSITVKGREEGRKIIIDVTDNGRGIKSEDHQRVFELFRRAGTQDKPGEGMGLAHVRALVRRLGGVISVASKPDVGSTFTVVLPSNLPGDK